VHALLHAKPCAGLAEVVPPGFLRRLGKDQYTDNLRRARFAAIVLRKTGSDMTADISEMT